MAVCKQCEKVFSVKPFWIKKGFGKYCSAACQHLGMRKGKDVSCATCGKTAYKKLKALRGSKSGLFFCGKSCQTRWRNQLYIGDKHANFVDGLHSYRSVLERNKVPKICCLCKTADTRVLAVHHIDKNRKNNALSNLAWLCHNCHFLVHHYDAPREEFMAALAQLVELSVVVRAVVGSSPTGRPQ
jgi:hypothetical protein